MYEQQKASREFFCNVCLASIDIVRLFILDILNIFLQIQILIRQKPQKFNKFSANLKWDEVRKRRRCECLTLVTLIVKGVIGRRGPQRKFTKSTKRECLCTYQTFIPMKLIKWTRWYFFYKQELKLLSRSLYNCASELVQYL